MIGRVCPIFESLSQIVPPVKRDQETLLRVVKSTNTRVQYSFLSIKYLYLEL